MALSPPAATNQPQPPKISPVDILGTYQAGLAADQYGYDLSDADFAKRFPGLVAAREVDMKKAYEEMTGPLAPEVQNSFVSSGLAKSLSAFGGGSEAPNVTGAGSIGKNTVGASVANDTQSYQDAARDYFESLQAQNQPRAFGLSGGDLLNLAILNQGNVANAEQQARGFASSVGAANAQAEQAKSASTVGAGAAIGSAVLGSVIALAR